MKILNVLNAVWLCCVLITPSAQIVLGQQNTLIYAALYLVALILIFPSFFRASHTPNKDAILIVLCPLVLLVSWLIASTTWTFAESDQISTDIVLLGALVATAVITIVMASSGSFQTIATWFFRAIIFFATILGLFVLAAYTVFQSATQGAALINQTVYEAYLTVSYFLGLALIPCIGQLFVTQHNKVFWTLLAVVLLTSLVLSFGRGPLLFSVAVCLCLVVYSRNVDGSRLMSGPATFVVIALGLAMILYLVTYFDLSTEKFTRLFFDFERELSEGGRGSLWRESFEGIAQSPLSGTGLSTSGIVSSGESTGYPHNIYLQLWIDGGLVALVLIAISTGLPAAIAIWGLSHRRTTIEMKILSGMFLYAFLNYQKSESAYSSRDLVLLSVLLIIACRQHIARESGVTDVGEKRYSESPSV